MLSSCYPCADIARRLVWKGVVLDEGENARSVLEKASEEGLVPLRRQWIALLHSQRNDPQMPIQPETNPTMMMCEARDPYMVDY